MRKRRGRIDPTLRKLASRYAFANTPRFVVNPPERTPTIEPWHPPADLGLPDANGYVIYDGPSTLTSEPIVVIVTGLRRLSRNEKTGGRLLQSFIIKRDEHPVAALASGGDEAICGSCAHRGTFDEGKSVGRSCYVQVGKSISQVWSAFRDGAYPHVPFEKIAPLMASAGRRGFGLRMGTYGDPVAVPIEIWLEALGVRRGGLQLPQVEITRPEWAYFEGRPLHEGYYDVRGAHLPIWTGYTHQWKDHPQLARPYRHFLMASVDTAAELKSAQAQGWRTFRVSRSSEPRVPGVEITCPASEEAGYRTTCDQCTLCMGTAKKAKSIVIMPHGTGKRFHEERQNPDEDLRALARAFQSGDEGAGLRYVAALLRAGSLPDVWATYRMIQDRWGAWNNAQRDAAFVADDTEEDRRARWQRLVAGKSAVERAELELGVILRVDEGKRDPWETADRVVLSGAAASRVEVLTRGLEIANRQNLPAWPPARWRRNPDEDLRALERALARDPHDQDLVNRLRVAKARAGDLRSQLEIEAWARGSEPYYVMQDGRPAVAYLGLEGTTLSPLDMTSTQVLWILVGRRDPRRDPQPGDRLMVPGESIYDVIGFVPIEWPDRRIIYDMTAVVPDGMPRGGLRSSTDQFVWGELIGSRVPITHILEIAELRNDMPQRNPRERHARSTRAPHHHPHLPAPLPRHVLEEELRELHHEAGGFDAEIAWPVSLAKTHQRNSRRYAQVLPGPVPLYELAEQARWLPGEFRRGIWAHEVGHVIAPAAGEDGADAAALAHLGVEIGYDHRWPGKGLQYAVNPWAW